jgi:hypothetical protein
VAHAIAPTEISAQKRPPQRVRVRVPDPSEQLAQSILSGLTLPQLEALAKDTRLPGEIGSTYGYSAAVIIRLQHRCRAWLRRRERACTILPVANAVIGDEHALDAQRREQALSDQSGLACRAASVPLPS